MTSSDKTAPEGNNILNFWFEENTKENWFKKTDEFDNLIREKYLDIWTEAHNSLGLPWVDTPENLLAQIIITDQFPRNMFRNHPDSFATDPLALALAEKTVKIGMDKALDEEKRHFVYMPYMHSEDLEIQEKSLELFNHSKFAVAHYDIIKRFGRFPHRNEILKRESTEEEIEFLKQPGSSF